MKIGLGPVWSRRSGHRDAALGRLGGPRARGGRGRAERPGARGRAAGRGARGDPRCLRRHPRADQGPLRQDAAELAASTETRAACAGEAGAMTALFAREPLWPRSALAELVVRSLCPPGLRREMRVSCATVARPGSPGDRTGPDAQAGLVAVGNALETHRHMTRIQESSRPGPAWPSSWSSGPSRWSPWAPGSGSRGGRRRGSIVCRRDRRVAQEISRGRASRRWHRRAQRLARAFVTCAELRSSRAGSSISRRSGLAGGRAPPGPRDQEPADPDPARVQEAAPLVQRRRPPLQQAARDIARDRGGRSRRCAACRRFSTFAKLPRSPQPARLAVLATTRSATSPPNHSPEVEPPTTAVSVLGDRCSSAACSKLVENARDAGPSGSDGGRASARRGRRRSS